MRTIKFRAWEIDSRHMWNVRELYWDDTGVCGVYIGLHNLDQLPPPAEAFIIMQFTGLFDKNGKEIYEGDLFNCMYHRDGCTEIYEIIYDSDSTGFVLKRHGKECKQRFVHQSIMDVANHEIIGNVMENPNLLTK